MLRDMQHLFDEWWAEGTLPLMVIATPTPDTTYYIEETSGSVRWESFLALSFVPHIRSSVNFKDMNLLAGISGGGYGALKLAFGRPELFRAVAVMHPMLEPALRESDVSGRNRLHHSIGGPTALIGDQRDVAIWEYNNPANRAGHNAKRIIEANLAIYLEAGDEDLVNAHDGTEFLHRVLWDLDISHEYHLVRGADHGGPTVRPRMRALFAWLGNIAAPMPTEAGMEEAASQWLQSGMQGTPPSGATATTAFVRFMRARLEPGRARAAETDASTNRRFGLLRNPSDG